MKKCRLKGYLHFCMYHGSPFFIWRRAITQHFQFFSCVGISTAGQFILPGLCWIQTHEFSELDSVLWIISLCYTHVWWTRIRSSNYVHICYLLALVYRYDNDEIGNPIPNHDKLSQYRKFGPITTIVAVVPMRQRKPYEISSNHTFDTISIGGNWLTRTHCVMHAKASHIIWLHRIHNVIKRFDVTCVYIYIQAYGTHIIYKECC